MLTGDYFKKRKEELELPSHVEAKIIKESQILTSKDLAECNGKIFKKMSEAVPKLDLLRRPTKHGKHKQVYCKGCNKTMTSSNFSRHLKTPNNIACRNSNNK